MYDEYYGMNEKAFAVQPDPGVFFESPVHKGATRFLQSGIENQEAFLLILGEYGTGKTLLGFRLADYLAQQEKTYTTVPTPVVSYSKLLKKILNSLECSPDTEDPDSLQDLLLTTLDARKTATDRITVIIDEIQDYDIPTLKKIRMLSNYNSDGTYPFQFVFLGHPSFLDNLEHPELEALDQRIRRRYVLEPFSEEQTKEYIYFRLLQAGANGTPYFPDESIHLIHRRSDGIPRIINNICDSALLLGAHQKLDVIGTETVQEAASSVDRARGTHDDARRERTPQPDKDLNASSNGSQSITPEEQTQHSSSEDSSHGRLVGSSSEDPFADDAQEETTEKRELFPASTYRNVKKGFIMLILMVGTFLLVLEVRNRWNVSLLSTHDGKNQEVKNNERDERQNDSQNRDDTQKASETTPPPASQSVPSRTDGEKDDRSSKEFELSDILAEHRPDTKSDDRDQADKKDKKDKNGSDNDDQGLRPSVDNLAVAPQSIDGWQRRLYPYSLCVTVYNSKSNVMDAVREMRNNGIGDLRIKKIVHGKQTIGWALYQGFYETRKKARQARQELGLGEAVISAAPKTTGDRIPGNAPGGTTTDPETKSDGAGSDASKD